VSGNRGQGLEAVVRIEKRETELRNHQDRDEISERRVRTGKEGLKADP